MLCTHCFFCWAPLTRPVFISVPRSVNYFWKYPEIERVSNASEILRDTLNIWYNDRALGKLYLKKDGFFSMASLPSKRNFRLFIKYEIICYVLNFVVEILLILTFALRSVDPTLNDSTFYVMWVVELDAQIKTSMSRLPVQFCGQFWNPLLK
jgi:hypothetical protein